MSDIDLDGCTTFETAALRHRQHLAKLRDKPTTIPSLYGPLARAPGRLTPLEGQLLEALELMTYGYWDHDSEYCRVKARAAIAAANDKANGVTA